MNIFFHSTGCQSSAWDRRKQKLMALPWKKKSSAAAQNGTSDDAKKLAAAALVAARYAAALVAARYAAALVAARYAAATSALTRGKIEVIVTHQMFNIFLMSDLCHHF